MCHSVAFAIYMKTYLKAKKKKRIMMKTQIFHHAKKNPTNLPKKKSSKRNQNPSTYYYNSIITNLKVSTQSQNVIFQKSSYKNRPIILLPRGEAKIPLSYYTL
jgi:hypothetical protein